MADDQPAAERRPAPEYGEYATPQEQARAAGLEYVPQPPPAPSTRQDAIAPPDATTANGTRPAIRGSLADRYLTLLLLFFGAVTLFDTFPGYLGFARQLREMASDLGVGDPIIPSGVQTVGYWVLAVNVVLYVATAVIAVFALSRRRRAFYIPVVGLFLYYIVTTIILNATIPELAAQIANHLLGVTG